MFWVNLETNFASILEYDKSSLILCMVIYNKFGWLLWCSALVGVGLNRVNYDLGQIDGVYALW